MQVFAKRAYLETGWATDVRLVIKDGLIAQVIPETRVTPDDLRVDTLLPALSNLHSHSFQRAMAGMTEFRQAGRENFWTWRSLMYQFLDHLTPDQIGKIARLAFMEMQLAGFAAVGEFHYLHHAKEGVPYADPAELSAQIMQAARDTGIGLTHLPVLYAHGNIGQVPLAGGQRRFGNTLDQFNALVARCRSLITELPSDARIGVAPHSLRAVSPQALSTLVEDHSTGPIHIHIAEQEKEVEDVKRLLGQRPVDWLLNNVDIDHRWCLIHANHMTQEETRRVADSEAIVGLCPITEANLGDGIFNAADYLRDAGQFGIGTDSNVCISVAEELRMLEYSQRLKHRQRNVLSGENGSTGNMLYLKAARGAAKALDRNAGELTVGKLADMVAIDSSAPALCGLRDDQILDGFIFAGGSQVVTDVWSAGRHQVRDRRHIAQDEILSQYRETMTDLMAALN